MGQAIGDLLIGENKTHPGKELSQCGVRVQIYRPDCGSGLVGKLNVRYDVCKPSRTVSQLLQITTREQITTRVQIPIVRGTQ